MDKIEWSNILQGCCDECPVISMVTCDECPVKMYGDLLTVRGIYGRGSEEEKNKIKQFNSVMSGKEIMDTW